jgi:hypothetical protein
MKGMSMTTYATTINTEAQDRADIARKIRAYSELYNLEREVLTYVRGTFKDSRSELVFLTRGFHLVTVTASAIMWYDSEQKKQIALTPVEAFDLRLLA